VSTDLVSKDLWLSISGTGPGIPRGIIEAVFDEDDCRLPNGLENGSRSLSLDRARDHQSSWGRLIVETSTGGNAVEVKLPHSRSI
jgi:hypothetical protein